MLSGLISLIKLNLVFLSCYLSYFQFKNDNKDLGRY